MVVYVILCKCCILNRIRLLDILAHFKSMWNKIMGIYEDKLSIHSAFHIAHILYYLIKSN